MLNLFSDGIRVLEQKRNSFRPNKKSFKRHCRPRSLRRRWRITQTNDEGSIPKEDRTLQPDGSKEERS